MTAQEYINFIWICEPKKGAIEVSDVIEAMELYHKHKLEEMKEFKNKYLRGYGCQSCWSDSHNCTCENDKDIIDNFVSRYIREGEKWMRDTSFMKLQKKRISRN